MGGRPLHFNHKQRAVSKSLFVWWLYSNNPWNQPKGFSLSTRATGQHVGVSYRLVLKGNQKESDQPQVQGASILRNTTGVSKHGQFFFCLVFHAKPWKQEAHHFRVPWVFLKMVVFHRKPQRTPTILGHPCTGLCSKKIRGGACMAWRRPCWSKAT